MKKTLIGAIAGAVALVLMIVVAVIASPMVVFSSASGGGAGCTVPAPGGSVGGGVLTISTTAGASLTLDSTQQSHARTIISVGSQEGVSSKGILIALTTALQESKLRMYANTSAYPESASYPHDADGRDHDSLNFFQQRPQSGWGTVAQLMDPVYAARAFFGGPQGPNKGSPRGLLDIPGWEQMDVGRAAQSVQVSAFPSAYDQWVPAAQQLLTGIGGVSDSCASSSGGSWAAPNGKTGADLIAYAQQFVGKVPYSGACGSQGSPSGWCCTGFVYYVYHQVLGIDLPSPVVSGQLAMSHQISRAQAQAGDLVAWTGYHIGIYDGVGGVIHSPDWGRNLEHTKSVDFTIGGVGPTFWRVNAIGAGSW
ncbi:C40 family peptidase [Leifsonia shinshuensis]